LLHFLQDSRRILSEVDGDQREHERADSANAADTPNAEAAAIFDVAAFIATLPAHGNLRKPAD
jgi:hypothetical protein